MNKSLLTALAILLSAHVFAQNKFPESGNVGIGTLSPQGSLDIFTSNNTATTPLLSFRSNFHITGNYGMIRFGDYTQTTDYQKGAIIYESVGTSARGKLHLALENTDGTGSVTLSDAKLTVLSNGNVGIGTTSPSDLLSVNGKIRAHEIKVETTNWPDYVFDNNYKPLSLMELEKFTQVHKHLPGIPTAKEVEKEGVDLGNMNKILVQKIEELTLHLIQQNQTVVNQAKAIDKLNASLEKQNKRIKLLESGKKK